MSKSATPVAAFERPKRTAAQREARRIRILAMLRAGHSYEAIARQEQLSRERVRQIVAKSLEMDDGGILPDPRRVRMAQLEPALRLAANGVENGDLRAIPHLLRFSSGSTNMDRSSRRRWKMRPRFTSG